MQLNQLTFTRFVAAAVVLIFHGARSSYPFTAYPASLVAQYGNLAVNYFFVLSGFIMAIAYGPVWAKGQFSKRAYWLARVSRIYPLYLTALLLVVFVNAFVRINPIGWAPLTSGLLLVQAWFPALAGTLNGPGWSLSVEAFFYALFPFVLPRLWPLSSRALVGWLAGSWLVGTLGYLLLVWPYAGKPIPDAYHAAISYGPYMHLPTFLLGLCGGLLYLRHAPKTGDNRLGLYVLGGALLLLFGIAHMRPVMQYAPTTLLAPLFLAIIVGVALLNRGWLYNLLVQPRMIYLGEISYGIYILQQPVVALLQELDPLHMGDTLSRDLVTFGGLFVISALGFHLIEMPAKSLIRRWMPARQR
ncbi:acyltransferase family protein [Fibrella aquatilis]|uniref:Acyltransferase n=1 Tax=Fibrella aquatilis TaxID=2817059 RepID=A0A939GDN8_9BACT|nr:acyltransferase [Fibrella aquatilis]MBO0934791.1 acyltransferase [Fibrella aquatilis]